MSAACERARQWASMDLDGELSTFEDALLSAHLSECADCRAFRSAIGGFTNALRTAPAETFAGVRLSHRRRRVGRVFAPAVAALAVVSVGLGSMVASSHLGSGLQRGSAAPRPAVAPTGATHDTVNARTLQAVQRLDIVVPHRRASRSGGGPYVQSP